MPDDQVIRPNIFKQQVLAESARLGSVKLGFEYLIFEHTVLCLYFMSGPLYIKQRLELFSQSRLLCLSINDFGHI